MMYEELLKNFLFAQNADAKHLSFNVSCHSVADAARAAQADPGDFVKNVCMIDGAGGLIVAIVKGEDQASRGRVAKAFGIESPRLAKPEEILALSGYPCGGTPSFGFIARFLIDPKVMEMDQVYTGGGSESSLTHISPKEILRLNQGTVVRIRR